MVIPYARFNEEIRHKKHKKGVKNRLVPLCFLCLLVANFFVEVSLSYQVFGIHIELVADVFVDFPIGEQRIGSIKGVGPVKALGSSTVISTFR